MAVGFTSRGSAYAFALAGACILACAPRIYLCGKIYAISTALEPLLWAEYVLGVYSCPNLCRGLVCPFCEEACACLSAAQAPAEDDDYHHYRGEEQYDDHYRRKCQLHSAGVPFE